jgi:branched-chain amino acid transport system substrate-binding protein
MPVLIAPWRQVHSRRFGVVRLVALALSTALLTAGCAGDGTGTTAGGGSAGPTATSSGDPWAVTDLVNYTGGTDGVANDSLSPVTIGWVNQQGGTLGFPAATDGATAAVKYINTHLGGIGGHPVKLHTCFVVENEQDGNACGLELVNDKAVHTVLYGTMIAGSQSFQAVNKGTKPILMSNSISPADATGNNIFIYDGNPASIFGGLATYVDSVLHAKSVSVIYPQDAQSTAGAASLKTALKSVGVDMQSVGFDPSTTNLTGAAVAAGAQKADAVIPLVSMPGACVAAAKAFDSLGLRAPIIATGSFCFTEATAKGLGGEAPKWMQLSTQTNVADRSQPDVQSYLEASGKSGLDARSQATSDAALAWSLVMTTARFVNAAGGADATEETIAKEAEKFRGPMLLGSAAIRCGAYPKAPGLCGAQTRVFKHTGGNDFSAATGWLEPAGM